MGTVTQQDHNYDQLLHSNTTQLQDTQPFKTIMEAFLSPAWRNSR